MATAREYLVSLGLAKPGRGRFSGEAKAALAKAIADGMTFDEVNPPAPKQLKVKTVGAKPLDSDDFKDISPKAVRAWAQENPSLVPEGIVVRDRGRVEFCGILVDWSGVSGLFRILNGSAFVDSLYRNLDGSVVAYFIEPNYLKPITCFSSRSLGGSGTIY